MIRLELESVADDGLGALSLRFEQGLFALFGSSLAPLGRLSEILAGLRRPQSGRVLLEGLDVSETPAARREIAALLPAECLLPAPTASASLELAAKLHGTPASGHDLLEQVGLSRLSSLPPERLSPAEQRALALVLAFSLGESKVFVLHDPFALHSLVPKAWTIARCREHARRACVLVTVPRLEDAIELGGTARCIERGRAATHVALALHGAPSVGLVVRSEGAEQLADLCRAAPDISHVLFDAQRSPRELLLFGPELCALARRVCELSRTAALSIDALAPLAPPLASGSA